MNAPVTVNPIAAVLPPDWPRFAPGDRARCIDGRDHHTAGIVYTVESVHQDGRHLHFAESRVTGSAACFVRVP